MSKNSKVEINLWAKKIGLSQNSWQNNNLHIDEIRRGNKLKRTDWIGFSFFLLENINKMKLNDNLIFFINFDLKFSKKQTVLNSINLNWLKNNLSLSTPPSLNFTTHKYYIDFYKVYGKEISDFKLIRGKINNKISIIFREYMHEEVKMYNRELNIFILKD